MTPETVTCPECGHEQDVVLGDFSVSRTEDDGEVTLHEITMHGTVEIASGGTLSAALENAAEAVK